MGDSSGISGLCKKKKVNFQSDLNDNKVHFQMALLHIVCWNCCDLKRIGEFQALKC